MEPIPFVDLKIQYSNIQEEIQSAINNVLKDCSFILGPQVAEFEKSFADFAGVDYAVGVSSGLDALRLALTAIGITRDDEVILPANTYIATALAVSAVGARPVMADCNRETYNIDTNQVESLITHKTRAIIPVHLTGQAADMDPLLDIADKHGLAIIEDAAQAHGAFYKNHPCGSLGKAGCFSFFPGKNLGAYGDGGIVTTNDHDLAQKLQCLRNYGQYIKYEHVEKGLNARLDAIQAAVLAIKLKYLPQWNIARNHNAERYKHLLDGIGDIRFQTCAPYSTHVYHLFIIETGYRNALQSYLQEKGIQTGIHYPTPVHLQPAYAELGYRQGDFPNSEFLARHMLSLPMFPEMSEEQISFVAETVSSFFRKNP